MLGGLLALAIVLTTPIGGFLNIADPSAAGVTKPRPRVQTVELHLRGDGAVALRIRVRHHRPAPGPQVFAFRPSTGKIVVTNPTPRKGLWRIGPNTHGARNFLNQLQCHVADGDTPALIAGVKNGVPKRFEITDFDSPVRGVQEGRTPD